MRAIIPLASEDPEFRQAGYNRPRPLIEVAGKPMIRWATDCIEGVIDERNYVFPILKRHVDDYNFDQRLCELYTSEISIVVLEEMVEGPAATVLEAAEYIDNDELVILFGDQYIESPIEEQIAETDADGLLPVFESNEPRWSYAETDDDGCVTNVVEKQVVSNYAIPGFHYFQRGTDFLEGAERMMEKDIRIHGIFKIAPVFNEMIDMGLDVAITPVDNVYPLGNPEDVCEFDKDPNIVDG